MGRKEIPDLARRAGQGDLRAAERLVEVLRGRSAPDVSLEAAREDARGAVSEDEARKAFDARLPITLIRGFDLERFGPEWEDAVCRRVLPSSFYSSFELVDSAVVAPFGRHGLLLDMTFWPCFDGWMQPVYDAVREEFVSTFGRVLTTEKLWVRSPSRAQVLPLRLEQPVDVRVVNMPGDGGAFRSQGDVGGVVEVEWTVELLGQARVAEGCAVDVLGLEQALLEPGSLFWSVSSRQGRWSAFLRADRRLVGDAPDHGWRALSGQP